MPLVGLFFCCCPCCWNCGARMYQKQTENRTCKRRFLYFFLFIITLIILVGNILAFYTNQKISNVVDKSFIVYNDTVGNMKTYLDSVPQQIDQVITASYMPINTANNSIINIGSVLGGQIKYSVELNANGTLNSVQQMVNDLTAVSHYMTDVNNYFTDLTTEQGIIAKNLSDVQEKIKNTKTSCADCTGFPSPEGLAMGSNFQNTLPDFTSQKKTVDDFLSSGINSTLDQARKTILDIPDTVKNQTGSTVTNVQQQLDNIEAEVQNAGNMSFITDTINTVKSLLNESDTYVTKYESPVQQYDYYRWIVGICLCCIVLLVVVCNLFGLLCGPCGHKDNVDPTERSCLSNSGGDFFMAGTGFSFIFAWLLMLVVVVLFIIGGNSYTLFCKPWANNQLFQFADTQVNLSQTFDISGLNISSLYGNCQNNKSLWQALNLNSKINLDSLLNISQYTDQVNKTLDETKINIDNITFLEDSQKDQVTKVSNAGINDINFTDVQQQMNKNITLANLTAFADQLDNIANNLTNTNPLKGQLTAEANDLRSIQTSINTKLLPQIKKLNDSINNLKSVSPNLAGNLNKTLAQVAATQSFVNANVSTIVKNEIGNFLNTILKYFTDYISWSKDMIRQNVARCAPVYSAVNSVQIVLCDYFVDSLNGFWFSLGWCTIFLIPSIILSVKLSRYYRRMKSSDTFEQTACSSTSSGLNTRSQSHGDDFNFTTIFNSSRSRKSLKRSDQFFCELCAPNDEATKWI
ncbi:prominin-1-A-like isoform X1 [Pelobates cultripes]|uniref:Prominin-1-A-like isoform X1 n=1 Tax=Pelobates cultripes TaxID=61616 RepID=A0AAD1TF94_PELCU|nr:prominin-1-A-like isoform X1 [Pelobates cultripes]